MHKLVSCFLAIIFLCACESASTRKQRTQNVPDSPGDLLTIDLSDYKKYVIDTPVVKNFEYLPLSAKYPIGKVDKIKIRNNRIYALDTKIANSVSVFDMNGEPLYSVNSPGRGPGEYGFLKDMDVSDQGDLYLLDIGGAKVIRYVKDRFEQEFKFNFWTSTFALLAKNSFVFYQKNKKNAQPEINNNNIIYWRPDNKSRGFFPRRAVDVRRSYLNPRFKLFSSNNALYFSPNHCDTVFKMADYNKPPKPCVLFRFGGKSTACLSLDEIKATSQSEGLKRVITAEIFRGIDNFLESEDYIVCSLKIQRKTYIMIYSKRSGKYFLKEKLSFRTKDYMSGGITPLAVYQDKIVGLIPVRNVTNLKKILDTEGDSFRSYFGRNKLHFLDKMTYDNINPVVVFWELKPF